MDLSQYSHETQEQAYLELLRETYKNSLFATCKHLLGMKDITWQTHGDMIRALEDDTKRKLLVMPRGTMKSSIGVVGYSIWRLMRNPNERILIDSEVYTNSKNFLREIKAHLASREFIEIFGDWRGPVWSEGEIFISTRTKKLKEGSIVVSGIGKTLVGQHFDTIIHDDLNSGNNSGSTEMRKKVVDHYRMNLAILEPDGTSVVIGTRYAVDDSIGHIIEHEIGYDEACRIVGFKI